MNETLLKGALYQKSYSYSKPTKTVAFLTKKRWAFFESWRESSLGACYRNIVLASINSQKRHEYIKLVTMSIRSFVAPLRKARLRTPEFGIPRISDSTSKLKASEALSLLVESELLDFGIWNAALEI